MVNNCFNLIPHETYEVLKKYKDPNKLADFDTEYLCFLNSLDRKSLEEENSQNIELLYSLEYTFTYIKSYYYVNILNVCKYICEGKTGCFIYDIDVCNNEIDNLKLVVSKLSKLIKYINDYLEYTFNYKALEQINFTECLYYQDENGNWNKDYSDEAFIKDTLKDGFKCVNVYYEIKSLCKTLEESYNKDLKVLDGSSKDETYKDRLEHYGASDTIFWLLEGKYE